MNTLHKGDDYDDDDDDNDNNKLLILFIFGVNLMPSIVYNVFTRKYVTYKTEK